MFFNAVFQSVSVDKLSFLMHPSRKSAVPYLLFRAHVGFIIAQLKTLSIGRGSQGKFRLAFLACIPRSKQ